MISLDLDFVIATSDLDRALETLTREYTITRFANTINLRDPQSEIRAQIQIAPRYAPFVNRAERRDVFGRSVFVASIEDLLQGKVWAASDPDPRDSKRKKDIADIARILESYPSLSDQVPPDLR